MVEDEKIIKIKGNNIRPSKTHIRFENNHPVGKS